MEFSIWCPTDGSIEVGLEDIESIIVRSGSDVEVIFTCPVCGQKVTLAAQVPHALLATLDEAWVQVDGNEPRLIRLRREESERGDAFGAETTVPESATDGAVIDAYCEYFTRELSAADTVEQILAEIDAHEVR
jgi:hypothetical protein